MNIINKGIDWTVNFKISKQHFTSPNRKQMKAISSCSTCNKTYQKKSKFCRSSASIYKQKLNTPINSAAVHAPKKILKMRFDVAICLGGIIKNDECTKSKQTGLAQGVACTYFAWRIFRT
jgi:hypothetical protein